MLIIYYIQFKQDSNICAAFKAIGDQLEDHKLTVQNLNLNFQFSRTNETSLIQNMLALKENFTNMENTIASLRGELNNLKIRNKELEERLESIEKERTVSTDGKEQKKGSVIQNFKGADIIKQSIPPHLTPTVVINYK